MAWILLWVKCLCFPTIDVSTEGKNKPLNWSNQWPCLIFLSTTRLLIERLLVLLCRLPDACSCTVWYDW